MTTAERLEEIQAAGARLKMHLNYGDGYGYVYTCIAEPRITLSIQGPKGRNSKRKRQRLFFVEGIDQEFLTLEEAVITLEKSDQANAADAEWEASAPKKKRPPPLPQD